MSPKNSPKSEISAAMTALQFAKFCGVSASTINAWCADGMPCERRGKQGSAVRIDVQAAVQWIAGMRAKKPDAARTTVAHEQAERLRIANARARRELIPANEVQLVMHTMAAYMVQACDAMPQRISADESVQAAVRRECTTLRAGFADRLEALVADG